MMSLKVYVLFIWALSLSTAVSAALPITLLYSSDLDGELEPCGCSELGDLGGLKRRATVIDRERAIDPNLLLLSGGALLGNSTVPEPTKARAIFQGISLLGYDVVALRQADRLYGDLLATQAELPWVMSHHPLRNIPTSRFIQHGLTKLRVFSWNPPFDSAGPVELIERSHQRGEVVVVLTSLSVTELSQHILLDYIDVAMVQAGFERYQQPEIVGNTLILHPGTRGMFLGKLLFSINEQGRVGEYQHQILNMPSGMRELERMQQWYRQYNAAVKADYQKRVTQRLAQDEGAGGFQGSKQCQVCHSEAYRQWQQSRHATALNSLQQVSKAFDPDCLRCHVVGLGKPGGFLDPLLTPGRAHVQCESCHGAGKDHVESKGKVKTISTNSEQLCQQCHMGNHSPKFKFSSYWEQISHGL
jgi:hypothetical protein